MKFEGSVSRREFLRLAGVAGATLGAAGTFGTFVSACGGEETTTTQVSAPSSSTAAPATTASSSVGGDTTTVSAAAETGREIKIGFVSPATGALAAFGAPDQYCVDRWREAIGAGLVCGDAKQHPIKVIVQDSQSDSNRAAQVAGDLINNENIDIMLCSSAPENANPVADQCETYGVPCMSTQTPWQAFFLGRNGDPKVGFKWTYDAFVGVEDLVAVYTALWQTAPGNKVVAGLWPNDTDGNVFRPVFTQVLQDAGYTLVDPGAFQPGIEDFTAEISKFKKAGAEILTGCMDPATFTNFWKQAKQQGFNPKVATIAKAILFPQSVEALGDVAIGLTSEVAWHPAFPFKSSLTGETCQMVADEYEKRTKQQWSIPLLHYIVGKWP